LDCVFLHRFRLPCSLPTYSKAMSPSLPSLAVLRPYIPPFPLNAWERQMSFCQICVPLSFYKSPKLCTPWCNLETLNPEIVLIFLLQIPSSICPSAVAQPRSNPILVEYKPNPLWFTQACDQLTLYSFYPPVEFSLLQTCPPPHLRVVGFLLFVSIFFLPSRISPCDCPQLPSGGSVATGPPFNPVQELHDRHTREPCS